MKKAMICFFMLLMFLILMQTQVFAEEKDNRELRLSMEDIIGEQLDGIDTSSWDKFLESGSMGEVDITGGKSAKQIIFAIITGKMDLKAGDVVRLILKVLFKEIIFNLSLMSKVIVIAVICGILSNMKDNFSNPAVGEISFFVCYLVVILLIIQSLLSILKIGREGIEQMVSFMQILFPVLIALLAAVGSIASTTIMQPAIALMVGMVSTFLKNTVLPLILFSSIITLINNIGERVNLNRLGKLVNNLCTWTLGGVFTIFIAVLSIQGVMAATFDGISVRTAKFALDTFVPIIGSIIAQSVDAVIGCSLLIKNAVGITGLIIIALISIIPGLKILGLLFIYKLTGALLEPVTDSRISDCLNAIGSILTVLFVTVMGTALIFFITVTLIISTGNMTVMLR